MNEKHKPTLAKVGALAGLAVAVISIIVAGSSSGMAGSPRTAGSADPASVTGVAVTSGDRHGAVVPVVTLDRTKVLARTDQELFVVVRFEIAEAARDRRMRPPLNLGLVIDRSGSMADEGKITHARDASIRLIDAMSRSDVLGVVEYDDAINVLWPSTRLTSPGLVKDLISELTPRGSTNLAGGLITGIEQTRRFTREAGIHRVLLLSDGLANAGITSPQEIARFVRDARAEGIGVSTIGLGLDYNEDLMQTIAEAGGGNYYYVESPAQVAAIFEKELSTLFTTVAKNVRLRFDVGDGIRGVSALGYDAIARDGGFEIPLENLYGGERRSVLLKLEVDAEHAGSLDLGTLGLSYSDPESEKSFEVEYELAVEATVNEQEVRASTDNLVSAEATLMTAEEEHERCVRDFESGDKDVAKQNLAALSSRIDTANQVFQDVRLGKKLEQLRMEAEDMDRAELNEENRQMYLKSSKSNLYQAQKGKRNAYLLQEKDNGIEVERLQTRLQELQIFSGAIDGIYSDEVASAVREYQQQNGLEADGIAGPATLRRLNLY